MGAVAIDSHVHVSEVVIAVMSGLGLVSLDDVALIGNHHVQALVFNNCRLYSAIGSRYKIADLHDTSLGIAVQHEQIEIDGIQYRAGVRIDQLTRTINEISDHIRTKKEREAYGYDPED